MRENFLNLNLSFNPQQRQALEKTISYLVDGEAEHFIEWLFENSMIEDPDNFCEIDATDNPETYDPDCEHIYTSATILKRMLEP